MTRLRLVGDDTSVQGVSYVRESASDSRGRNNNHEAVDVAFSKVNHRRRHFCCLNVCQRSGNGTANESGTVRSNGLEAADPLIQPSW